jgi:hypothetical protein
MTDYSEYYKKSWEKQLTNERKQCTELTFNKVISALRSLDGNDSTIANSLADKLEQNKEDILK